MLADFGACKASLMDREGVHSLAEPAAGRAICSIKML